LDICRQALDKEISPPLRGLIFTHIFLVHRSALG